MLKIGEFSKLSRVSIRMLRHYDDIGLLKPAEIDTFTGYRYYRADQLFTVGRITSLKDMGFSLADIIKILDSYDDREKMNAFLSEKQKELAKLNEETQYRLMLLETARRRLRKEQNMSFDVTIKTIPERYVAAVQMVVPHYEDEGLLWNIMMKECDNLVPADPCLAAAEFPDDEYKEENVGIIVWMTVKGEYNDTEHVRFKKLPAVQTASCIIKGSYDQMSDAYAAAVSWIDANGYRMNGHMFNIYHVSPAQTQNPDEYVTEVCFPVE